MASPPEKTDSSDEELDDDALARAEAARQQSNARSKVKQFLEQRPAREIFEQFDKDGSGAIEYEEFVEMLPALGIKMNEAKAKTFFRACDQDFSGAIDFEEFELALHAADGAGGNSLGFTPKEYVGPHDAFEMFDEDFSGALSEDEFAVALEYLNIKIDGGLQERLFMAHDLDASGAIEYKEFREIWLKIVNLKEELKKRNLPVPRWTLKSTLRESLEDAVIKEDEMQEKSLLEADHWYKWNLDLKRRKCALARAFERLEDELTSAMDLAGEVYMFGTGASGQFMSAPVIHQHSYIAPIGRYAGVNENRRYIRTLLDEPVHKDVELGKRLWDMKAGNRKRIDEKILEEMRVDQEKLLPAGFECEDRELSRIVNLWMRRCSGLLKVPRFARQPYILKKELENDPPDPYAKDEEEVEEDEEDSDTSSNSDAETATTVSPSRSPNRRARIMGIGKQIEEEPEPHYFDLLPENIRARASFFKPGTSDALLKKCMTNWSTAGLWGRRIINVSVGGSVAYAVSDMGEIFAWGGQHGWDLIDPDRQALYSHPAHKGLKEGENKKTDEYGNELEKPTKNSSLMWNMTDDKPGKVTPRTKQLKGFTKVSRVNAYDTTRRKRRQKYVFQALENIEEPPTANTVRSNRSVSGGTGRDSNSTAGNGRSYRDEDILEIEEELAKLEEDLYTDLREKQCHEMEMTTKYFEVWEPSPSASVRYEFYTKVLLPKLSMDAIELAFSIRGVGFDVKNLNKIKICEKFSHMIELERKFLGKGRPALGMRMSQRLRDLEKEWVKLSRPELLPKKRQLMLDVGAEGFKTWAPIRTVKTRHEQERTAKQIKVTQQQLARQESEYMMWRHKLAQAREDLETVYTVRGGSIEVPIGGITARGPEELTPRGNSFAQMVSAGNAHSCLVLGNGDLYTWGTGTYGRLGHATQSAYEWTGQKRKTPSEVKRLQERVYECKTQDDLDYLLTLPEYDTTQSLLVPRRGPAPSHRELAKREFERDRILNGDRGADPRATLLRANKNDVLQRLNDGLEKKENEKPVVTLQEMAVAPPPVVQIPKLPLGVVNKTTSNEIVSIPGIIPDSKATGGGSTHRSGSSSLRGEMEKGRSGYWEQIYRGNDREDLDHPSCVQSLRGHPLKTVSAGFNHSIAVTVLGETLVWGDCSSGKLGIGETFWEKEGYTCYVPMPWLLPLPVRLRSVSAGFAHSAFIGMAGELYVCGCNDGGRLGLGPEHVGRTFVSPTLVESVRAHIIVKASCGASHTMLLTESKTVMLGEGFKAEKKLVGGAVLQAGSAWAMSGLPIHTFELVKGPLYMNPCCDISAGTAHSGAVTHDGELYTWGGNLNGGAGHPVNVVATKAPTLVECLYQKARNLVIGKEVRQSSTYTVGVKKWHQPEAASNGDINGDGEKYCTHTCRDDQAWWEVDLGALAVIEKIVLWNRTDEPADRGQPRDYFSRRLFPCWVIVSSDRFPDDREEGLDSALEQADCARKFTENVRCSEWVVPVNTTGRYVRVQLETKNFLHFAQLEVFGNWGRARRPISTVECGRDVTVAVARPSNVKRDIEEAYLKCVKADAHTAILLRQYETFQVYFDKYGVGEKIGGECILCTGMPKGQKCEICYLHQTWPASIEKGNELYGKHKKLSEIAHLLMHEQMPPMNWHPTWRQPRRGCKHTFRAFGRWWQKIREGGYQPTWEEVAEYAAKDDNVSREAFETDRDRYKDDDDWSVGSDEVSED